MPKGMKCAKLPARDSVSSNMDDEKERDALWELLGRARRVEASPYFARKVLATIQEQNQRTWLPVKTLLRWLIPTAVCAGLAIGWISYQHQQEDLFNADFDSAADLQSLVASDDSLAWFDDSAM
jgi:hypothetical protein